ncbi:Elongator complex protein 1 [Rhizoctonia solani]|uniref:Elongator complex protein 1 n=1 Tax=Rhizoctonia solani TaxID=456999 RepID=A0A0K6FT97_9AGAM|nr:Elongator complex protein 1 [Rhizoctonia solani]
MYNLLSTVGRTSGHKYYSVLEYFTKPGFGGDVKDRYRELMWTHRRFLHLLKLRRSGHLFEPHPDLDVFPGDQSFRCVACPLPGLNFSWDEVSFEEIQFFRFWLSFDGNFRSFRKSKKVDIGDICLSDGLAYFSLKSAHKLWTETVPQPKRTSKPACDHHKAGNDTSVRWAGHDVTGVGAFTCTSHSCFLPQGIVDFFKGERFMYADYAFACVYAYLIKRGALPIGMTYNVWCHWIVNFAERAALLPEDIALPDDIDLVGAIPKWHLTGHERQCFVRWSLDHTQYVGRMEGEGPERVWAHVNEHSGSTSEMSPGQRTDSLNNIAAYWNFSRATNLHVLLPARFVEASKMYKKQKKEHDSLTQNLPPEKIAQWEEEPIEPVEATPGKWISPMMDPVLKGGFHEAVSEERKKEASTTHLPGRRPGATRWLSEGIELEHSIRKFADETKELGSKLTQRQITSVNSKRITLRNRIKEHLEKRDRFMADMDQPDSPRVQKFLEADDDDHWLQEVDLAMPSSYKASTISQISLTSLSELEKQLRRAMCNEALEAVKKLLRSRTSKIKHKDQHIRGQVPNTRARGAINLDTGKVLKARWRYENSRTALVALGMNKEDESKYLELALDDLKPLKAYYDDYAKTTGHGYNLGVPWIWKSSAAPNTEDSDVEGIVLLIRPSVRTFVLTYFST